MCKTSAVPISRRRANLGFTHHLVFQKNGEMRDDKKKISLLTSCMVLNNFQYFSVWLSTFQCHTQALTHATEPQAPYHRTNTLDIQSAVLKAGLALQFVKKGGKYLGQNERRDEPTEESDWTSKWSFTRMVRKDTAVDATSGIDTCPPPLTASSQVQRWAKVLLPYKLASAPDCNIHSQN